MDSPSNSAPRVPAWKRIGLKLKYAKDTTEENTPAISTSSPNSHQEPFKPRKRSAEVVQPETPAKRIKASKSEKGKPGLRESVLASQAFTTPASKPPKRIVFDDEDQPISADGGRPGSLRKSVSFTPDTKNEDGFSASSFFKAWVNGGNGDTSEKTEQEESTSPSKEPPKDKKSKKKNKNRSKSTLISAEESTEASVPKESKPQKSRSKESKSKKSRKSESASAPIEEAAAATSPYIAYLTQYHTSKATWKFNKKHQNNLLKNLFNVYRIPPKHNPAIVAYIAGLQGSARIRVAEEAAKILMEIGGEDAMTVDGGWQARRDACFAALEEQMEEFDKSGEQDGEQEETRSNIERGKRAQAILKNAMNDELLLSSVFATSGGEKALSGPSTTSTTLPSAIEDQPELDKKSQRRKRKARTDVSSSSSDSSSSESSESESSSDSDSDSD